MLSKLPGLLSFMTYDDFNAEVKGLDKIPRKRPAAGGYYPLRFPGDGGFGYADDGACR